MCDYSLMSFPNRLAREGEELLVHRFPSGSKGLASITDLYPKSGQPEKHSFWMKVKDFFRASKVSLVPAVCIPPGARLRLHEIGEEFQREYHVGSVEEAVFTQVSAAPQTYRDAICFRSGKRVRLQELPEGQQVTVLNLAADEEDVPEFSFHAELSRAA